ncbi:hypothetical protein [Treponema sp.]|uniref:hypothetical protein n=1 Tax=Treponema sp. TaxID=166 RepID=UPI00388D1FC2
MDIQARKRNKAFVCSAFVILVSIFSFVSCDMFYKPVRAWFEYYTDNATIGKYDIVEVVGTSSTGIQCIESNDNKDIKLYLMNTLGYELDCKYVFDNPEITVSPDDVCTFVQSMDKNVITLTFSQSFLHDVEMGNYPIKDEGGTVIGAQKDLSGTVRIFTNDSVKREFDSFHISVIVNSAPPRIRGAVFQRNKTQDYARQNGETAQFVICFNVPILSGTVHEKDTKKLSIGSEIYNLAFTDSGSSTKVTISRPDGGEVNLKMTAPDQLFNIDSNAQTFEAMNAADGYIPLYYMSGIDPDIAANSNVSKTITLTDDYGFSKSVTVSAVTEQLTPVTLCGGSNSNVQLAQGEKYYVEEQGNGTFNLVFKHDRSAIRTTSQAQENVSNACPDYPSIEYKIYKADGTEYKSGTKKAPVSVALEKGKYYVEAYAFYTGFIESRPYEGFASHQNADDMVTIYRNPVYYVKSGSSTGNGSRTNPYNSIQNCIDAIQDDAKVEFMSEGYTINLLGDITGQDSDFNENNIKALAFFKKDSDLSVSEIKFTINGNGHKLNAARDSTNTGRVICAYSSEINLNLDNVVITGGYLTGDQKGAGIFISKSAKVTLQNGTSVTGNTAAGTGSGGGISISGENNDSACLNLYGSSITGNTANDTGGGIYYGSGTINIKNTNIIDSNYKSDGTTPSNLYIYCDKVLNVTGPVTGSTIRVSKNYTSGTEPQIGTPKIFTSKYNYNSVDTAISWGNTDLPGRVFKGEGDFFVVEHSGEAAFARSGSGIYTAFDFTFDFDLDRKDLSDNKHKFYVGHKKVFTVTPIVKLGTTSLTYKESSQTLEKNGAKFYTSNGGSEERITWDAKLLCGGELTGTYAPTVSTNKITINNTLLYPETFILRVTATYMGVPHSKDFTLYGIEPPPVVSNLSELRSAITNMPATDTELTLLATSKIEVTGALTVPSGKTLTLIRSDDISSSNNMIRMSEGANLGSSNGGTLYIDGDNFQGSCPLISGATFGLYKVVIMNYTNTSGNGGAISNGENNFLTMKNCIVVNCHAKNGGAMSIPGSAGDFTAEGAYKNNGIENCIFRNCTAKEKGGVIYKGSNNGNRSIVLINNIFEYCSAETGNLMYIDCIQYNCKVYRDIQNPVYNSPTSTANAFTQVILDD